MLNDPFCRPPPKYHSIYKGNNHVIDAHINCDQRAKCISKKITLNTQHSLADAPEALRLDYVAACLLPYTEHFANRPADDLALKMLIQGLILSEDQKQKVQQDLSGFNAEKINHLFAVLSEKDLTALYLIDLAWLLLNADVEMSDEQSIIFNTMAQLLSLSNEMSQIIWEFVVARCTENNARLVKVLSLLPESMTLQAALPNLLKPCFQFNGLMFGQWIDHGDCFELVRVIADCGEAEAIFVSKSSPITVLQQFCLSICVPAHPVSFP